MEAGAADGVACAEAMAEGGDERVIDEETPTDDEAAVDEDDGGGMTLAARSCIFRTSSAGILLISSEAWVGWVGWVKGVIE